MTALSFLTRHSDWEKGRFALFRCPGLHLSPVLGKSPEGSVARGQKVEPH